MPFVRITLSEQRTDAESRGIADAVHSALVRAIRIPERDRFQLISRVNPAEIIADEAYLGIERRDVLYVEITLVAGRSDEQKRDLFKYIAENVAAFNVRPEDVTIVLTENSRSNWSVGNGIATLIQA